MIKQTRKLVCAVVACAGLSLAPALNWAAQPEASAPPTPKPTTSQSKLNELKSTIEQLKKELESVKSNRQGLQQDLEGSEKKISELNQKVEELKKQLEQKQTKLNDLHGERLSSSA